MFLSMLSPTSLYVGAYSDSGCTHDVVSCASDSVVVSDICDDNEEYAGALMEGSIWTQVATQADRCTVKNG